MAAGGGGGGAGGWGGGAGGWSPMASMAGMAGMAGGAGNAGNLLSGAAGGLNQALALARRAGGPGVGGAAPGAAGMAEGGQPPTHGGSAIPQESARADLHRLLMQAGAEPSPSAIEHLSGEFDPMNMPPSPFHSTNPRLDREMTHRHPARSAAPDPQGDAMRFLRDYGEENPLSAPMGQWPYNRTGVTPSDPFGLRPDPNDPTLLSQMRTDPRMHRAMDRLLMMLTPGVGEEGSTESRIEDIIRMMVGAPNSTNPTISGYPGTMPDQAGLPLDVGNEAFEHARKHGSGHGEGGGGEHAKPAGDKEHEGKIHVKEHWRGGRAKRAKGGVVKKALSVAKRHRKVAGRK